MTAQPALDRKRYTYTDVGNAQRLVDTHGRDLRWVARWKSWLVWDGRRWARDERGEVERRAKGVIRDLYQLAFNAPGDERATIGAHAAKSEAAPRVKAMVDLARSEPGIAVGHEDFDQAHMHLTVRNGTIDLRTGKLGPHDRGHLSTKMTDVDFCPDATCPLWLATLPVIFGGDVALVEYLQRAIGYSLTGDTREQILHLCYGTGANGKSTVFDVLAVVMGDYGMQSAFETFLETKTRGGGQARGDVARLAGARMVRSSEVGENKRLNEGLIKEITGGELVTARHMYGHDFEFRPQFKLWLAANHKPNILGTDYAIWRRMRLIPFEVTFTPENRDDTLKARLLAEVPGILSWAIEGCQSWLAEGLKPPERVLAATDSYRTESDVLAAFLEDCCDLSPGYESQAGELYKGYVRWAKDNGEYAVTARSFGLRLTERGFVSSHGRTGKIRHGLRLAVVHSDATPSRGRWNDD